MQIELKEFRNHRVQAAMEREKLDVLVASLPEHILYLLNFTILGATYQAKTQNYAVCGRNDDRFLVISPSDAPTAMDFDPTVKLICHGGFHFDFATPKDDFAELVSRKIEKREASPAEGLIEAIRQCCPHPKRIAIDELRTPITTWRKVEMAFPEATVVPALTYFEEIRCIKHPDEIAGIEQATNIAENSLLEALSKTSLGDSEYDMGMRYREMCAKRDGHGYFCTCTVDGRTAFSDTRHRNDARIQNGSIIRFDYGATKNFYRSDLARTVLVGNPNEKARREYSYLLEGLLEAEAIMRPGVWACEVFEKAVNTVRKGIPDYQRHHCGHGIGLQIYDPLPINASCKLPLQEGMVFCIETPYYRLGEYGLQIEDTVAVTKDGIRRLAHTSNDLIHILEN